MLRHVALGTLSALSLLGACISDEPITLRGNLPDASLGVLDAAPPDDASPIADASRGVRDAARAPDGGCAAGYADCDGNRGNGCEVELASDPAHCGVCGRACESGVACTLGYCEPTELASGVPIDEDFIQVAVDAADVYWMSRAGVYRRAWVRRARAAFASHSEVSRET
jgi:hypothetical protein